LIKKIIRGSPKLKEIAVILEEMKCKIENGREEGLKV